MSTECRQFPRLKLPADTLAVDESFRQLGKVEEAGGGGLTIRADSEEHVSGLELGRKLKLSIFEASGQVLHSVEVVVRYRKDTTVGVEFVSSSP